MRTKREYMDENKTVQEIIFNKDEVTWQSILYDLINKEGMDPWNIDISLITKKYVEMIKELQDHDFKLSGKVLLAAAILLKIKSKIWIKEDIANLDSLFHSTEDEMDDLLQDEEGEFQPREIVDANLIPRTPQPRKRKVSIHDLVSALEKALEVKHRRVLRDTPVLDLEVPKKRKDITEVIRDIYTKIHSLFTKEDRDRLTFSNLTPSKGKEDKVYTFIPLLHLSNQRKIDIHQYHHFGEIEITMKHKKEVEKELASEES